MRQAELLRASGYHLVDVPEKGTLTVHLTSHAPLTLLVFAPAPHGAGVGVEATSAKTTLTVDVLVPGKYLVQVRAKGDGKGQKGATYAVRASFARARVAP